MMNPIGFIVLLGFHPVDPAVYSTTALRGGDSCPLRHWQTRVYSRLLVCRKLEPRTLFPFLREGISSLHSAGVGRSC
ncbi:hypothetical protein BJV78DRAFT_1243368 [Lactifluus subvellereus]|nr:hypothetical protein BJV78DRAFT_1243368 [Lactifluus subvellereus]